MVKIIVSNNVKRFSDLFKETDTLRYAFEKAEIDYSKGISNLDGASLSPGDLDKTFEDFGITSTAFLTNVVKANNA